MRKMKYVIGVLLFLMLIGFATVTVSLSLSGKANVLSDLDDFNVYFSNVLVNNEQDLSLVKSDKELEFSLDLREIGSTYSIRYDVTNASSVFDASLSINCTDGDDLLLIENVFDTSTLVAKSTRTGTLTLKKLKPNLNPDTTTYSVSCTINATAISRDSNATGNVFAPLQPVVIETGDIISIDGENFNVISQTDDTVTMLAQYNLGIDYRQSESVNNNSFSYNTGWEKGTDINIQSYDGFVKTYVNEYVSYLKSVTDNAPLTGNLISLNELKNLGCTIQDDYSSTGNESCVDSQYAEWLILGTRWWTRSSSASRSDYVWAVDGSGDLFTDEYGTYGDSDGIRPTITISRSLAVKLVSNYYNVGDEVVIGEETFNVISDNGDTVTMLAANNLGNDYRQTDGVNYLSFYDEKGWAYTPPPQEIDIQLYDGNVKTYVNEYVSYLKKETGDINLSGTLISSSELKKLGCEFSSDYDTTRTCINSSYEWLFKNYDWYIRTAHPKYDSENLAVSVNGSIVGVDPPDGEMASIRPTITISKKAIEGKMVLFTVDNIAYQAEYWMTLKDWVNSSYNTDGYYYSSSYLYNSDATKKASIDSSTLITNDLNIILSNNSISSGGAVE